MLGQRVNGGAARVVDRGREVVGVDREEQARPLLLREGDALLQRQEGIVVAGKIDLIAARRRELVLELFGELKHDLLLRDAARARRAGIDAAMTGIEHDASSRFWTVPTTRR